MIRKFLSETALNLHKEHLKKLKLQYSVFEKSKPEIIGKDISEISRLRIKDKAEIIKLSCDIRCHELFFSSFGTAYESCVAVRKKYRAEASFLYELYECGRSIDYSFIIIYLDKEEVRIISGTPEIVLKIPNPMLAIDLYEHSYFLDYGFDKEEYLKNLIPFLNLSKLDKFLQTRIEKR